MTSSTPRPVPPLADDLPPDRGEYEYRLLTMTRGSSRAEVRRVLTEYAEYERWELARVQLLMNGTRRIWLRRKIIRVVRTG
ncbi:MAG TPA: DUF5703 family protein [Kineosporiaceae bacterium]